MRKTKETFNKISQRAQTAKDKEREISEVRKKYLPIASRAADLYNVLADLTQINYMYQFSLEWFMDKYTKAVVLGNEALEKTADGGVQLHSTVSRTDFNTSDFSVYLALVMDLITENIYKVSSGSFT